MFKVLIKIANDLDSRYLCAEADKIDTLLLKFCSMIDQDLEEDDDAKYEEQLKLQRLAKQEKERRAIDTARSLQIDDPSSIGLQVFVPSPHSAFGPSFDKGSIQEGRLKISGEVKMGFADKPRGAFWTSTLDKGSMSSEWLDMCRDDKSWEAKSGDSAGIFKIKDGAKILRLEKDEDYELLLSAHSSERVRGDQFMMYALQMMPVPDYEIVQSIDWGVFAKEYDGVYCTDSKCSRGWDAESIAWFNMDAIELVDIIKINDKCRLDQSIMIE